MTDETMLGRDVSPDEAGWLEPIPLPGRQEVEFRTQELQALCPRVAGVQPDIYDATITLHGNVSIESKSLKLWLTTFRDRRIFAEHLAAEMAERVSSIASEGCKVDMVSVVLVQNVRGGIVETVTHTIGRV